MMRVITNRRLVEFAREHPDADEPLQIWRKLMESNDFQGFNGLRKTFSAVDIHDDKHIFDIRGNRGNRYRIITGISFTQQICYIKHVLTHADYDKGKWK
jgi:mRNA interferase HigB